MTAKPAAPSSGAPSDARIRECADLLQQIEKQFPDSIATTIQPGARRAVLEHLARELKGTGREAIFACLLHDAVANPDHHTVTYLPLEKLNAPSRLEFGNRGSQPFHRQRAVKK